MSSRLRCRPRKRLLRALCRGAAATCSTGQSAKGGRRRATPSPPSKRVRGAQEGGSAGRQGGRGREGGGEANRLVGEVACRCGSELAHLELLLGLIVLVCKHPHGVGVVEHVPARRRRAALSNVREVGRRRSRSHPPMQDECRMSVRAARHAAAQRCIAGAAAQAHTLARSSSVEHQRSSPSA